MLSEIEGIKNDRQMFVERAAEAIGAYAEVRDMAQLPGWATFIKELQRMAVSERQTVEDLLDAILINRTPTYESQFVEAKIRLLALEEAIQLYLKMRERSVEAKEALDTLPIEVRDLPQNG